MTVNVSKSTSDFFFEFSNTRVKLYKWRVDHLLFIDNQMQFSKIPVDGVIDLRKHRAALSKDPSTHWCDWREITEGCGVETAPQFANVCHWGNFSVGDKTAVNVEILMLKKKKYSCKSTESTPLLKWKWKSSGPERWKRKYMFFCHSVIAMTSEPLLEVYTFNNNNQYYFLNVFFSLYWKPNSDPKTEFLWNNHLSK